MLPQELDRILLLRFYYWNLELIAQNVKMGCFCRVKVRVMSQAQDESEVDSGGDRRGSFWMMTHPSPPNQRFGQVVHLARIIRGPDTSDPTYMSRPESNSKSNASGSCS